MQRIRSIELRRGLLVHRIDVGRTLAMMVTIGLVLVITVSLVFSVAARAGIAPEFDQQIALNAQDRLVIHNGPSPRCASTPNPPQHDCFRTGPEPREFSVYYLRPHGVRSLLWFRLPPRCPMMVAFHQASWEMKRTLGLIIIPSTCIAESWHAARQ